MSKELAAIYEELKSSLIGPLPSVSDQLAELLYKMPPAKEEDINKLSSELKKAGHGDLVKRLLDKPPRVLVGVLYSYGTCGEAAYNAYKSLLSNPPSGNVIIEDFSTDALTVADAIRDSGADKVVILAIKRRNRKPGVYVRHVTLKQPTAIEAVEEIRPSLEGLLDVDALLRGLNVFLGKGDVEVHECEPKSESCEECTKLLIDSLAETLGMRDVV